MYLQASSSLRRWGFLFALRPLPVSWPVLQHYRPETALSMTFLGSDITASIVSLFNICEADVLASASAL